MIFIALLIGWLLFFAFSYFPYKFSFMGKYTFVSIPHKFAAALETYVATILYTPTQFEFDLYSNSFWSWIQSWVTLVKNTFYHPNYLYFSDWSGFVSLGVSTQKPPIFLVLLPPIQKYCHKSRVQGQGEAFLFVVSRLLNCDNLQVFYNSCV